VEATPATSFGIEQTRDVVRFAGRLTRAFRLAMSDGKINVKDVRFVFDVIPTIKPALDGSKQVKYEVSDLSSEEIEQLAQLFAQQAEIAYTPIIQTQLQHVLETGDGLMGMVVAMTRVGNTTDADELPITTE